jgi:protein-S-isoprenylcysteine O-methyltransferase Ste14
MPKRTLSLLYLLGVVATYAVRAPYLKRIGRVGVKRQGIAPSEYVLSPLWFLCSQVLPAVGLFWRGLDFADYRLPRAAKAVAGAAGAASFAAGLWLLRRGHADLGRNWSSSPRIREGQQLVTGGVYAHIRHPIYAAHWLWMIGQALLLQNWLLGLAGPAAFAPIYLLRLPREERQLEETFGDDYRSYRQGTGAVLPRLSRGARMPIYRTRACSG